MNAHYDVLQKKIGYHFTKPALLEEALTHKSCKKEYNNERLEFLGDAVLDLVVGEYLFFHLSNATEGEMSKIRASLVNEMGFAKMAHALELGKYIRLSNAEENNNGREKPSLLSNAFEAVMGAIYLDSDLDTVAKIVNGMLETIYPKIDLNELFKDYKTTLQELTQARFGEIPTYELTGTSGPDHKKEFEIALKIQGKEYAVAKGKSKKTAQQAAAKEAIKKLKGEQ
jgi:ribonuclease-3